MRILITGATGFIGQHLVKKVLEEEDQVRVLVRKRTPAPILQDNRVEVFCGDLTIQESLRDIARGIEGVIHAAGVMGKWGVSSGELFQGNVAGVKHLLEACRSSNIQHFIHLSSCGVSGPLEQDGADEETPCNPSLPYERVKYQGERIAQEMAARHQIPLTIVRPTFTYGPGDLHHLPLFRLIQRGLFVFLGDGRGTLHPVYIDDLVEGVLLCRAGHSSNRLYILGGGEIVTIRQLASCLAQGLGARPPRWRLPLGIAWPAALAFEMAGKMARFEPPITRSRLALFTRHHGYTIAKARRELGYQPRVGLHAGLEQTIRWYRDQGYLEDIFSS